jgi:hypothetical protein
MDWVAVQVLVAVVVEVLEEDLDTAVEPVEALEAVLEVV